MWQTALHMKWWLGKRPHQCISTLSPVVQTYLHISTTRLRHGTEVCGPRVEYQAPTLAGSGERRYAYSSAQWSLGTHVTHYSLPPFVYLFRRRSPRAHLSTAASGAGARMRIYFTNSRYLKGKAAQKLAVKESRGGGKGDHFVAIISAN